MAYNFKNGSGGLSVLKTYCPQTHYAFTEVWAGHSCAGYGPNSPLQACKLQLSFPLYLNIKAVSVDEYGR